MGFGRRWAGIGLQGAAGWFKKGCRDLGVRTRIGRPARSPGRGSRLAVTRPGEAGETSWRVGRGAEAREKCWVAELRGAAAERRWRVGPAVRAGDVCGVDGDGADVWGRAVGDGASARHRSWSGARV